MLHIVSDPRNLFLVTLSPAFLLFLLSNVFSFGPTEIRLAVLGLDRSPFSRRYPASLDSDRDVVATTTVDRQKQILPLLTAGQVDVGLVIPPGFGDFTGSGQTAHVQAIIDGADPFSGRQALSTLSARSAVFVAGTGRTHLLSKGPPIELRSQAWYNAGLKSLWSMVPGLLAIVLTMPTLAFAPALSREKETGTLEGLMASPVSGMEYLTGKPVAYVVTGLVSTILALLVAILYFKVPFRGSLAVYLLLAGICFLACMGATVVIANFVRRQQSARSSSC